MAATRAAPAVSRRRTNHNTGGSSSQGDPVDRRHGAGGPPGTGPGQSLGVMFCNRGKALSFCRTTSVFGDDAKPSRAR